MIGHLDVSAVITRDLPHSEIRCMQFCFVQMRFGFPSSVLPFDSGDRSERLNCAIMEVAKFDRNALRSSVSTMRRCGRLHICSVKLSIALIAYDFSHFVN